MSKGLTITVTLRKRDTGWRVWAFQSENLDWARAAAQILVDSPTFRHCYAVATDWNGDIMFECRPQEVAPPPAPVPRMPPPQRAYGYAQMQAAPVPPPSVQERMMSRPSLSQSYPSYGPPPVPSEEIVVYPEPARTSHRSAYGPPPPLPHNMPKLLGNGSKR